MIARRQRVNRLRTSVIVLLAFVALFGCDADSPIAPSSTVLSVRASPTSVETGETSTITVSALRPDGNPASGAEVTLTASAGSVTPTTLTLNPAGSGTAVFTAPADAGTVTVTARLNAEISSSIEIEVTSKEGQITATPDSVELDHSREDSNCVDPIMPKIELGNAGTLPITYRVIDNLPDWLAMDVMAGPVPSSVQAIFTCDVGEGDLDLNHLVMVQGVDESSGEDVGERAEVAVTVRVRD